jgi:CHRD domain-containing protein
MKHASIVLLAVAMVVVGSLVVPASVSYGDDTVQVLTASLKGIEEPPSISSTGRGSFRATVSGDGTSIDYRLSYEDLEGDVLQAHIHLGQRAVNGGIAAFLCSNLGNGPAGTPLCPGPKSGNVSGTITAAEVVGPSGQGLAPGEFAELLRAIDTNVTYANVHSTKHTGGEIRGQIRSVRLANQGGNVQ